jgi:hypothetical protein
MVLNYLPPIFNKTFTCDDRYLKLIVVMIQKSVLRKRKRLPLMRKKPFCGLSENIVGKKAQKSRKQKTDKIQVRHKPT